MERLKQVLDRALAHADAGIGDLERDADHRRHGERGAQAQADKAVGRELRGVADQIEQDLLDALRIGQHPILDALFDRQRQVQALRFRVRRK
jgi:hypothetical protein